MKFLSSAVLLVGAVITLAPASAAPYIVYQGSTVTALDITPTEAAAQQAKINSRLGSFQKQILAGLAAHTGSSTNPIFMIVDEANMTLGAILIADPTKYGGRVLALDQNALPSDAQQQNFISGFQFSLHGSLGILRLSLARPTGVDDASGQLGAYNAQFYGTGTINSTANFALAPKQPALTFNVVQNGVKGQSVVLPAFPPVVSSGEFIPTFNGEIFYTYFDDGATESVAASSTHGTFTLTVSPTLTALANNGGRYIADPKDIGYIPPVAGSDVADMKMFIYNIMGVYPQRF
jgi:hypothetical protein